MNILDDLGQLARYLRNRLRFGRNRESLRFDLERGVQTAKWTLTYEPSPLGSLREMFDALPIDPAAYTFCDLGCGKGRVLLVAADLPFAHVIGVEVEEALYRTALRNVEPLSERIEVFWLDATQFQLPAGPLVLFLFNPFEGEVLDDILRRMPNEREIWLMYLNPLHGQLVSDAGFQAAAAGGAEPTHWVNYHRV